MAIGTSSNIDRYLVLGNLGRGAKSSIWKVQDPDDGRIYTLKQVIKENEGDTRFFDQAQIEYDVSSRVDHPYLRKSFTLKRIRKWLKTQELILVMEYVEGAQLKQMGPSGIEETIKIFTKVAQGLSSLHEFGYVHADVKPKNILTVPNDGIKIIDFGQSCPMGHKKNRIQGTPDYMAPEQKERGYLDQRTDIFNLGASLYWVTTGTKFPTTMSGSGNGNDLSGPANYRNIPRPDALNTEVPPALSKLIMDCCKDSPKERPQSMREVIGRLEVAWHLYEKQNPSPPVETPKEEPAGLKKAPNHADTDMADDDSDDFEKFIESIL
ncbi:MAG: serine/threonine-protein kinase [Phycisphaerae bacterium]